MTLSLSNALPLVVLLLLFPSRIAAAATTDGGLDGSIEAGAPGELMRDASSNDASDDGSDQTSDEVPLRCDGGLCDTTTGATTCSFAAGRSTNGGGLPIAVALALLAIGVGRRTRHTRRNMP
jgi:hypothetical protein